MTARHDVVNFLNGAINWCAPDLMPPAVSWDTSPITSRNYAPRISGNMQRVRANNLDSTRYNVDKTSHLEPNPQTGALDNSFTLEDGMFAFYTPIQLYESSNQSSTSIYSKSCFISEEDEHRSQEVDFAAIERLMIWQDTGRSTKHIYAQTSPDVGQQALPDYPFLSLPPFYAPIYSFLDRQSCPLFHLAIPPPSQTTGSSVDTRNITSIITISLRCSKQLWLYLDVYRSNTSLGSFRTKMRKEASYNSYRYSTSLPDKLLETLYQDMINDPATESDTLVLMRFIPEGHMPGSWDDTLFVAIADFIRAPGAMMDEIQVHRIPNKLSRPPSGSSDPMAHLPPRIQARVAKNYPVLSLSIPSENDPVPILFCAGPQNAMYLTPSSSVDVPESAIRSPSDSIP